MTPPESVELELQLLFGTEVEILDTRIVVNEDTGQVYWLVLVSLQGQFSRVSCDRESLLEVRVVDQPLLLDVDEAQARSWVLARFNCETWPTDIDCRLAWAATIRLVSTLAPAWRFKHGEETHYVLPTGEVVPTLSLTVEEVKNARVRKLLARARAQPTSGEQAGARVEGAHVTDRREPE